MCEKIKILVDGKISGDDYGKILRDNSRVELKHKIIQLGIKLNAV